MTKQRQKKKQTNRKKRNYKNKQDRRSGNKTTQNTKVKIWDMPLHVNAKVYLWVKIHSSHCAKTLLTDVTWALDLNIQAMSL